MYIFNHFVTGAVANTNGTIVDENDVKQNTDNAENYQKYSKTIDNTKIELNIPNEWKYEKIISFESIDDIIFIWNNGLNQNDAKL